MTARSSLVSKFWHFKTTLSLFKMVKGQIIPWFNFVLTSTYMQMSIWLLILLGHSGSTNLCSGEWSFLHGNFCEDCIQRQWHFLWNRCFICHFFKFPKGMQYLFYELAIDWFFFHTAKRLPRVQPTQNPAGMVLMDRPAERTASASCCS